MNFISLLDAAAGTGATNTNNGGGSWFVLIAYIVVLGLGLYFLMIRPQKKQQAKHQALMSSLAVGDSVLTTAGFYGIIIDIQEDMVIVEFGNNKNCRIPMQKSSIVEVEKATEA